MSASHGLASHGRGKRSAAKGLGAGEPVIQNDARCGGVRHLQRLDLVQPGSGGLDLPQGEIFSTPRARDPLPPKGPLPPGLGGARLTPFRISARRACGERGSNKWRGRGSGNAVAGFGEGARRVRGETGGGRE